jgi:hypothetical protein
VGQCVMLIFNFFAKKWIELGDLDSNYSNL